MPPPRWLSPGGVLRAGTALTTAGVLAMAPALPWRVGWAAAAAMVVGVIGESAVVPIAAGRRRWLFSGPDAGIALALTVGAGGWVVVGVLLAAAAGRRHVRQPRLAFGYHLAGMGAAAAAAVLIWHCAGAGPAGAGLGILGYGLGRHVVVAVAVGASSTRPMGSVLASSALPRLAQCGGSASVGILAGWLVVAAPYGLIGLVVPLLAVRTAAAQDRRRATEVRLLAELTRGEQQRGGRSLEQAAEVVITAAARVLGGADVEILLTGPDSPVHYLGNEYGVPERRTVDASVFDQPWVLRTLGRPGACVGFESGRPYCSAQVSRDGRLVAVLMARRPAGSASFSRAEIAVADVLAEQAAVWLSSTDCVGSDTEACTDGSGQAGTSALVVVNSAAGRLARLTAAAGSTDRMVDILTELYAVERAVACLVGTLTPSEPVDPLVVVSASGWSDGASRPHSAADWTTSGVLRTPSVS